MSDEPDYNFQKRRRENRREDESKMVRAYKTATCKCGCGEQFRVEIGRGRIQKYIKGHDTAVIEHRKKVIADIKAEDKPGPKMLPPKPIEKSKGFKMKSYAEFMADCDKSKHDLDGGER